MHDIVAKKKKCNTIFDAIFCQIRCLDKNANLMAM